MQHHGVSCPNRVPMRMLPYRPVPVTAGYSVYPAQSCGTIPRNDHDRAATTRLQNDLPQMAPIRPGRRLITQNALARVRVTGCSIGVADGLAGHLLVPRPHGRGWSATAVSRSTVGATGPQPWYEVGYVRWRSGPRFGTQAVHARCNSTAVRFGSMAHNQRLRRPESGPTCLRPGRN